jgi:hypothetical protein
MRELQASQALRQHHSKTPNADAAPHSPPPASCAQDLLLWASARLAPVLVRSRVHHREDLTRSRAHQPADHRTSGKLPSRLSIPTFSHPSHFLSQALMVRLPCGCGRHHRVLRPAGPSPEKCFQRSLTYSFVCLAEHMSLLALDPLSSPQHWAAAVALTRDPSVITLGCGCTD